MEVCDVATVEKEVVKVIEKFHKLEESSSRNIEDAIQLVRAAKNEIENGALDNPDNVNQKMISPAQTLMLIQAMHKIKETATNVGSEHRDLHGSVSKVGKTIDRCFVADYDSTSRDDVFSSPEQQALLNKVILQHFCRQGLLDISDDLIREAKFPIEEDPSVSKASFQELNLIQEAFLRRDIGPALEWAIRHREQLNNFGSGASTTLTITSAGNGRSCIAQKSSLEMKLHKLRYIELLCQNQMEAVMYARTYFPRFIEGHEREIQASLLNQAFA